MTDRKRRQVAHKRRSAARDAARGQQGEQEADSGMAWLRRLAGITEPDDGDAITQALAQIIARGHGKGGGR